MSSNTKNDDDDVDVNPGDTTDNSSGGGANPASCTPALQQVLATCTRLSDTTSASCKSAMEACRPGTKGRPGTKEENASSKSLNFFYVMAIFVPIYFIGGLVTFYYGKNKPSDLDLVLYRKCLTQYIIGALLAGGISAGAIVVFEGENPKVNFYSLIPFIPAILTVIWLCVSRVAN
ncbi:MAG: YfhO family protein, partial [Gammaproteobacteria bacterium]|nr:YfhO family protein [Gammaproteobacteria bacterium]